MEVLADDERRETNERYNCYIYVHIYIHAYTYIHRYVRTYTYEGTNT